MPNAFHLPPFTPESAKIAAQKSVAARRERKAERERAALNPHPDANPATERLSRLWACLAQIDKRIMSELIKAKPDGALLKDLAATARSLRDQAGDAPNGSGKRAAAPPPPDLPEPTA